MTPRELSAAIGPWPLCLIPPRARRSTR
ncbi:hypothetical protein [Brucella abortus]|nr:hypothetical protein [Brucella abortus]